MSDNPASLPPGDGLPPDLRFLKMLVTALAGTMILGLLAMIAVFVIRLPGTTATAPVLPDRITLPRGETARAVTIGKGWIAVVTENDQILILDPATGALRQRLTITPAR